MAIVRRRGSGVGRDLHDQPNLIPMLDVVLQLITFFMMLVHFGTRIEGASAAIRLPVTAAALPGADLRLDRLVVLIDPSGRVLVPDPETGEVDRELSPDLAEAWWAEQADRRRTGLELLDGPLTAEISTRVLVRADRQVSYGQVRRVLVQAQERGFARFSLIVERERK